MVDTIHGNGEHFSKKTSSQMRSFHFRYLELCRSKNFAPVPEVKAKNNIISLLDFFGDKLRIDDWLLIIESLHYDQTLQNINLKLRKNLCYVLDNLDTDKKARMLKKQPVIFTKFIFSNLVDAVSNSLKCNRNLNTLNLEGLPLDSMYIISIAKALSLNENLQTLSFNRSSIGDEGCDVICNTLKHLLHIESVSMSQCQLTVQGANHIADMIKIQKILRYSEGWKKSLRYRDVNPESIPGLRSVNISQNNIGDKGTELITEIMKEDIWIKEIDLSECGLTDVGAKYILDCLEINKYIIEFRIKSNSEISTHLLRAINEQLGKEENIDNLKKNKINVPKMREMVKMLEEQIVSEKYLRKQVENLNEQLHAQIMCYERKLTEEPEVPEGYSLIKDEELEAMIRERDELKNSLSAIKQTKSRSLRKISKIRKARSETKYKECIRQSTSRSEHVFKNRLNSQQTTASYNNCLMSTYVEKSIGDTASVAQQQQQQQQQQQPQQQQQQQQKLFNKNNNDNVDDKYSDHNSDYYSNEQPVRDNIKVYQNNLMNYSGIEAMKLFAHKKQKNIPKDTDEVNSISSARSLFMGNDTSC